MPSFTINGKSVSYSYKAEQDKLNAAIAERIKVRGSTVRTFAQIVNTALFYVAQRAQQYTPRAEPAQIRASAFVEINFVINKKLERVPGGKGKKYIYSESNNANALGEHAEGVELAYAIVLARANLSRQGRMTGTSRYNQLTYGRWALTPEELKGGRKALWARAERMVSARMSSISLIKAGWKPAMDILRPLIARNQMRGTGGESFPYNENLARLGTAVPAREGWVCSGMIENHVGQHGGKLSTKQTEALFRFGVEPLQRALAEEAADMLDYVQKYLSDDAREFNRSLR